MQTTPEEQRPSAGEIPPHLDRWNWGAFLLNWIWGIGNSTWIALLCLIPVVNFVMMVVLGARGSRWAWRNRLWHDEEHFRRTQRNWAIAGVIVWLAVPLLIAGVIFGVMGAFRNSEAFEMSMAEIRQDAAVRATLGEDIVAGWFVTGNIQLNGPDGRARLQIPLKGEIGSGTAYTDVVKQLGVWQIRLLIVRVEGKAEPVVIINRNNIQIPGGPLDT